MFLRFTLCVAFIGLCITTSFTQPIKKLKAEADELYNHHQFRKALSKYYNIQYRKPGDMDVRLKIGACSYYVNKPAQAKKYLHYIVDNEKDPNPDTYLYLGKIYHAENNFKEAVKFYKQFLRTAKPSDLIRNRVKEDVRRCATGLRIVAKDQIAIVENLGNKVNSEGDDFAPVLSPNFGDKIYFSSARTGNKGGLRDDGGFKDEKLGNFNADMFSTQIVNGEWTATTPMNPLLNSSRHDVVLGFDEGGSVLYYFKGPSLYSGEILVDTFRLGEGRPLSSENYISQMKPELGDDAPCFFNDSTLIFSSRREGGYGGKDLYISLYSEGYWGKAQNLGPVINSAYDETTPFLSYDGRTLYFSSNNVNGIGGLDVFKSSFDDISEQWSTPVNLGIPVNSAGDDAYFKLSRDGYKGYFSSSRIDSEGQRDIYVAYFKNQRREQLAASTPAVFSEVRDYKRQTQSGVSVAMQTPNSGEGTSATIPGPQFSEDEITEYELEDIFYKNDENILSNKNKTELNKVARLMIQYPQLHLILTSNSDGGSPRNFDLYFSLKRAEEASDYLVQNGVNPRNITMIGAGSNYPVAKLDTESNFNVQATRLNRRIDIELLNTTGLPIRVSKNKPVINNRIKSDEATNYRTAIQGLSYKVQIAAIKQLYSGEIIMKYPDAAVEADASSAFYKYTVGLYQTFSSADQLRKELIRQGATDAFVIPYINGRRVSKDDSKVYSAAYPDLLNYLNTSD